MNRPLAAALAALVLMAGVAGAVTALPESTAEQPTAPDTSGTVQEPPEPSGPDAAVEPPRPDRILDQVAERYDLTDEQVAELRATIEELDETGASPAETRAAVAAQLASYGVDRADLRRDAAEFRDGPDHRERPDRLQPPRQLLVDFLTEDLDLTDEQVAELRETVREERADGSGPAEVREAVVDQLAEYGITEDDIREAVSARAADHLGERFDLDDDQVAQLEHTVLTEIESGAYPAEVRAAVIDDLRSFDAIPEDAPRDAWAGAKPRGLAVGVQFAGTGAA